MAFYFLLRVGEYTLPPEHRTTRTVQFRICDIQFWQGQTLLPPTSDAAILTAASSVTLINHREAVKGNFCPVRSTAARVSAIMAQGIPLTMPIIFVQPGSMCNRLIFCLPSGAEPNLLSSLIAGTHFPKLARIRCPPRAPWPCGCPDMARRQS